ncbi:unnamed protein product [Caenorhabditis bovis]|uniref:Acyl_transf_3 domain-containing protein n=1 Tax=Caenorhabditis bovis TaxID=2654633 RepID=A0A8S1F9H9_9PELO|nr:unnamed protein product [Caenorhabditis bovis]
MMRQKKRSDLQGIRGIAIISVLGFHFYPSIFPNGYLGVDQFFVLSGFLMCMLLKRSESDPIFTLILNFYTKRFRRILPLYYLIILLCLIALYMIFPATFIENNLKSARNALLFVSNRPKTANEDYFEMMGIGSDLFTHTWSLSVEIQFYCIIPIIFVLGRSIFNNYQLQIGYYAILAISSIFFHLLSTENVSFNSVFARIWQFNIGIIVYLVSPISNNDGEYKTLPEEESLLEEGKEIEEDEEEEEEPPNRLITGFQWIFLISTISIQFSPFFLPYSRIIVTILIGLLIYFSSNNLLLINKFLVYVGDISYTLYLVHWPIYTYWKSTNNSTNAIPLFIAASLILSILIHETFEKFYLGISTISVFVIVILLLIANLIMLNYHSINDYRREKLQIDYIADNLTLADVDELNHEWTRNDNQNLFSPTCQYHDIIKPLGWCTHQNLSETGPFKIMLFGNSWTANHAKLMYDECSYKAYRMIQASTYGCEPLYPSDNLQRCKDNITEILDHMEKERPDYGFLFTRYFSLGVPLSPNAKSLEDDEVYQFANRTLHKMIELIKIRLYILDAIPRIRSPVMLRLADFIEKNIPFSEVDKMLVDMTNFEMARTRYARLFSDCGTKCRRIDYVPEFFNNSTHFYRFFDDRGLSYFTGANHMTPHGLEKVRHIYTEICSQL